MLKETQRNVLDHGYVKFIEHWGSDERIIEAARMSTDGAFRGWGPRVRCSKCGLGVDPRDGQSPHPYQTRGQVRCEHAFITEAGDEKLLRYLYEHKHSTPFEMAGMVIEVQAPIFVFRQWHRHRTQSYNELSARYTALDPLDFLPTVERCIVVPGKNKQARGTTQRVPTHEEALAWLERLAAWQAEGQSIYTDGLDIGIPKELARGATSVFRYSRMRASANLRNWLAFLTLRMDSHAQEEIRVFADVVGQFVKQEYPRTWELFVEGVSQ